MKKASRLSVANAKVVETTQREVRAAIPLHPLEWTLIIIACVHLCFLPWSLGARDAWAQLVSLGFGLVAFVVGLWPRRYSGDLAPQGGFILHPWSRVLKFPVFWIGLLLFAYVTCQGLNPAYVRATAGPYWWIAPVDHIEWLPSGVAAPFAEMNAWRPLIVWVGAWSLACALWAGLTRRSGVQIILNLLVINGVILALIGILQKVTKTKEVLWSIKPVADYFVATFFYKNHAGAYLNLIAAISIALLLWHHIRSLRRMNRSSPAPVYAFAFIVLAALVFMSGSRASMILLAIYTVVSVCTYFIWRSRSGGSAGHPAVTGMIASGVIGLLALAVWFLNLGTSIEQIRNLTTEHGHKYAVDFRVLAREATLDLHQAQPISGWGAGSFRNAFPIAQRNYSTIFDAGRGRAYGWDHAHNDDVEALAELGYIGALLPAAVLVWWFSRCIRTGALGHPAFLLFLFGIGLPLAHAWIDFPMNNPAIFTTVCAAGILLIRWAELELDRP